MAASEEFGPVVVFVGAVVVVVVVVGLVGDISMREYRSVMDDACCSALSKSETLAAVGRTSLSSTIAAVKPAAAVEPNRAVAAVRMVLLLIFRSSPPPLTDESAGTDTVTGTGGDATADVIGPVPAPLTPANRLITAV